MFARLIRRTTLLFTVVACTTPARAEVEPGAAAPQLALVDDLGAGTGTLEDLRGRVVLLEFFATGCPRCQTAVTHLNALARRFNADGVVVLATSRESPAAVRAFAKRYDAVYAVTSSTWTAPCDWELAAVPTLFLVLPNGRVAWRGLPEALTEAALARTLERVPTLARLPDDLGWVRESLASENLAAAQTRLETLAAGPPTPTAQAAGRALAFLDWYATSLDRQARRDVERGREADAVRTWEHLARAWRGTARGTAAATAAAEAARTPRGSREVTADRAFCDLSRRTSELRPIEAAAGYEAFATRWSGTQAARWAACRARDLTRSSSGGSDAARHGD